MHIRISGNISALDKAFNPKDDSFKSQVPINELLDTWAAIDSEYTELIDTGKLKDTLTDTLDMTAINAKYYLITQVVDALKVLYHPEFEQILREEGYDVTLDPTQPEKYYKALNRVLTLSKSLIVESKIKEEQIRHRESVNSDDETETIDEGDNLRDILNIIRADAHYFVDPEKITVYDFTWMYHNLMKKLRNKSNG